MTTQDCALLPLLLACTAIPILNRGIAGFAIERRVARARLGPLVSPVRGSADIRAPDPVLTREPVELLVNQRTAWALGITVPRSVLGQATEVVQ